MPVLVLESSDGSCANTRIAQLFQNGPAGVFIQLAEVLFDLYG